MPERFEGIDDQPNVAVSEAAGGGKRKSGSTPGFEGVSESNLVDSEAVKAGKKGAAPKAKDDGYRG